MKKVLVLLLSGLMGITVATFGQDRPSDEVARAQRVDRMELARLQQARIKQARLNQPDLTQQRIEQARIKQARITHARVKHARIQHARLKQQRIKNARIKAARLDAAGDNQTNRRRWFNAKKERRRLASQESADN